MISGHVGFGKEDYRDEGPFLILRIKGTINMVTSRGVSRWFQFGWRREYTPWRSRNETSEDNQTLMWSAVYTWRRKFRDRGC